MKKVMEVIGVIIFVIAAAAAVLVIKGVIRAKKPSVKEDYYTDFSASAPLEQKYSQPGENAEILYNNNWQDVEKNK